MDETYIRVKGQWCYLYRAIDSDGNLVDSQRSRETRYGGLEQDHRGIKQRYYPMPGFGNLTSAAHFCCAFDELRNYLRPRHIVGETMTLTER